MPKKLGLIISQIAFFTMGAIIYPRIEMMYRGGYTHWTMAIIGGICLLLILDINIFLKHKNSILRLFLSTFSVISIELISGLFLNKLLQMEIWDYSTYNYNFCGQICLEFSCYWLGLCFGIIILFEIFWFLKKKIVKTKAVSV